MVENWKQLKALAKKVLQVLQRALGGSVLLKIFNNDISFFPDFCNICSYALITNLFIYLGENAWSSTAVNYKNKALTSNTSEEFYRAIIVWVITSGKSGNRINIVDESSHKVLFEPSSHKQV